MSCTLHTASRTVFFLHVEKLLKMSSLKKYIRVAIRVRPTNERANKTVTVDSQSSLRLVERVTDSFGQMHANETSFEYK